MVTDENAGMPWPPPDLRAFLAGEWRLERAIADRRLGRDGGMEGTARFAPAEGGTRLVYRESGVLRLGDYRGAAEQTYYWDFPTPRRAALYRHDGSFFHDLDLERGWAEVVHSCGDDLYRGRYVVSDAGAWRVEWQVAGPRKDQRIVTHYRRLPTAEATLEP